ncbi:MAG: hypothetical protein HQK51_13050 [Oligoflexia bacterium]|nr:hypothetical protein [Oligoflexia bacterium]
MKIKFRVNSLISSILTSIIKSNKNSFAKIIVVSDLDDTLRMTNVKNTGHAIVNHIIGIRPFHRLIDIYHQIKNYYQQMGEEVIFYYLSSSPRIVDIKEWLNHHGAPEGIIRQRNFLEFFEHGGKYKIKQLKKFLKNHIEQHKVRCFTENFAESDEFKELLKKNNLSDTDILSWKKKDGSDKIKILFFGDNGQHDPLVYSSMFVDPELDFKGNNIEAHIFIRKVDNRVKDIPGVSYFNNERELLDDPIISAIIENNNNKKCG